MPIKITTSKRKPPSLSKFRRHWIPVGKDLYGPALYRRYPWNEDETVYVLVHEDKRLVGYAHLWIDGGVVFVEELLLHQDVRGRGAGKRLMAKIEAVGRARKCHKISLDTDPKLEPANSFYKKCGFKKEATLPRHYAKRPTVFYGKRIG